MAQRSTPTPWKRNPTGLWLGYWFDLSGKRLGRATRKDLATAYYLKAKHADIWTGRALTDEGSRPPWALIGERMTARNSSSGARLERRLAKKKRQVEAEQVASEKRRQDKIKSKKSSQQGKKGRRA